MDNVNYETKFGVANYEFRITSSEFRIPKLTTENTKNAEENITE